MRRVIGIHLVARTPKNIHRNEDGTYSCRAWKIARRHTRTATYVALHDRKASLSYLQGALIGAHPDDKEPDRWVLLIQPDNHPREWHGGGSGEKGYLWNDA